MKYAKWLATCTAGDCEKELSIMERKLYESAYNLLIYEIAMAKNIAVDEAGNIISEALSGE